MNKLKKPHALSILLVSLLFTSLPYMSSGQALNNNSGYLSFYDTNGGQAVSPVIFSTSSKGKISALNLSNNNIFVAYSSADVTSKGMFTITDQLGSQINAPAIFDDNTTNDVNLAVLDNRNVMIIYSSGSDKKGNLILYNEQGQFVNGPIVFSASSVDNITALELNNGNVLIIYNNKTLGKGCYQIYDKDGGQSKGETIFSDNAVADISSANIADNNIFVSYSSIGTAPQGKYFIMNRDGNISLFPLVFSSSQVAFTSTVSLDNTNVMVAYSDNADNNYGKFQIFDKLGALVSDASYFIKTASSRISASRLYDNNVMIAYIDGSDLNKGKFVIVGQLGNAVKDAAIFSNDPVGYVLDSQMSNRNQIVTFNILMAPACSESNWQSSLEPSICPESGKQTRSWILNPSCSGGVSHPASEEISCTYNPSLPACVEADWVYKIEPSGCPASGEQNKIWQTIKDCNGGVSHTAEKIKCVYQPENKVIIIKNGSLYSRLKGKIIINVSDLGKAYYVDTRSLKLYYLGRPADAFQVIREQGLGVKNIDLARIPLVGQTVKPANINFVNSLKGKILLQVQSKGEAWYINPTDGARYYLGRPADAFALMRKLGLGINNITFANLQK